VRMLVAPAPHDLDDRECAALPEFVDNQRRRAGTSDGQSPRGYAGSGAFTIGTGQQAVEVVFKGGCNGSPDGDGSYRRHEAPF
jgi:hypothetical protein